jgi:predicted GIY-YIG superfamily endonuclease
MAQSNVSAPGSWCVYLLRCGDGTLYCGITNRLQARLSAHRSGKGARYTRGRGPLRLVFCEPAEGRGAALRREHAIKQLALPAKRALVRGYRKRRTGVHPVG